MLVYIPPNPILFNSPLWSFLPVPPPHSFNIKYLCTNFQFPTYWGNKRSLKNVGWHVEQSSVLLMNVVLFSHGQWWVLHDQWEMTRSTVISRCLNPYKVLRYKVTRTLVVEPLKKKLNCLPSIKSSMYNKRNLSELPWYIFMRPAWFDSCYYFLRNSLLFHRITSKRTNGRCLKNLHAWVRNTQTNTH